jgi:hypothetical protein
VRERGGGSAFERQRKLVLGQVRRMLLEKRGQRRPLGVIVVQSGSPRLLEDSSRSTVLESRLP